MKSAMQFIALCFMVWTMVCTAAKRPNIIFVLTDDQDLLMGSVTPIKKVQKLVANEGVTFTNAFVSTPICCPSRSSILTGLYQHNHRTLNNSWSGGCSDELWQRDLEPNTFAALLHAAQYRTFYAGKYLNAYGYSRSGGTEHVPQGWDWWLGLVGNSRYYNYTLSINGTARHFSDQYLTNVIQNYSVEFLESVRGAGESFLMVLAPPACHTPYTPEPKYRGKYRGIKVPRTPNFNTPKLKNRHWLLNMGPEPLGEDTVRLIDEYHAMRWETLMSVDDMVAAVVDKLRDMQELDNTYIIYTSDHGYHLGQFALPWDKRQPYETDIRVPMFVRGPGIEPKALSSSLVVNIDIAPTIVDMAGLAPTHAMDGVSFLPLITNRSRQRNKTRDHFFIEYVGEGNSKTVSSECPLVNDNTLSECSPASSCKCQDSRNNTYNCLRRLDSSRNLLYCEFFEDGNLREMYNINKDPYQLKNVFSSLSPAEQRDLHSAILHFQTCQGSSCRYQSENI